MIPRYTRPEMGRIWTPERRFRIWLDVELAACEAMVRLGQVPPEDFAALRRAFDGYAFTAADVARIEEIERTVKHDVIAFLTFVEEKGGPAARHLHKGMTSSDVLDTTLAVQLAEATALLLAGVDRVLAAVKKRALEHAPHADDGPQPRHPRRADHLRPEARRLVRRVGAQARGARARRPDGGRRQDLRRGGDLRERRSARRGVRDASGSAWRAGRGRRRRS